MSICVQCKTSFEVTNKDREFYHKFSPVINGQTFEIPEPLKCPQCREIARLVFRNERYYYQRKCDLCAKSMISVYDPAHTKNVYCHECWWSDKWDVKNYGREYDSTKSFFSQYKSLLEDTPKLAMMNDNGTGSENCEYTYDAAYNKNCYLLLASWYAQDCMYSFQTNHSKDCVDCYVTDLSEIMYSTLLCEKCYNCQDCHRCYDSRDCVFGYDLKNCKDCLLSAGLRNKQYYIWNQPYTKEEYFKKKAELRLDSWGHREKLKQEFATFIKKIPRRFANFVNSENCSGDNLVNSKDAEECYNFRGLHSCKWMTHGDGGRDSYDCNSTGQPELCYNCITPDNSYQVHFSIFCWKCQYVLYSDNCHSSHDLFGCVSMKRQNFCILNKQYTEEEYHTVRAKIILNMQHRGEWGELFSPETTCFAYNETSANDWYPASSDNAKNLGYRWQDKLPGSFNKETISWSEVPQSMKDIPQDGKLTSSQTVWSEIYPCTQCGKNYKILQQEFIFYKNNNIPLPRQCADCRYRLRTSLLNKRQLWYRKCMCTEIDHKHHIQSCTVVFNTTYSPDHLETVLCEECYLEEIV